MTLNIHIQLYVIQQTSSNWLENFLISANRDPRSLIINIIPMI